MHPLIAFRQVLVSEMGLSEEQVYFYQQRFKIPPDDRTYVAIGLGNDKIFGSKRSSRSTGDPEDPEDPETGLVEDISVSVQANLQIELIGKNPNLLFSRFDLVAALNSTLAQQMQQHWGFMIARHSKNFVNLSQLEGSAIPYRFSIQVALQYSTTKSKQIAFYDTFTLDEVLTEG